MFQHPLFAIHNRNKKSARYDYRMIPRPADFPIGIQQDPDALFPQGEFVIPSEARQNHTAIFGMTGTGCCRRTVYARSVSVAVR